jgi:hypothetical protein
MEQAALLYLSVERSVEVITAGPVTDLVHSSGAACTGGRAALPETKPPVTPCCVTPIAYACCVLVGPGMNWHRASNSRNSCVLSHLRFSTNTYTTAAAAQ